MEGDLHSGLCASPAGLLAFVLACIILALCLTLVEITALAVFWLVFGLKAIFIVVMGVSAVVLHCHWAASFGRRRGISEALVLFAVIQAVALVFSLIVIAAKPWLAPLDLVAHDNPGFFLFRNMLFAFISALVVSRYLALQARWRAQVAAESSARLESLQARIRPHFLFNALNTISGLIHDKPDQAEQATLDLSELLRTGLREEPHQSLSEELDLVRGYLRIECLRLGDRLNVEWRLGDDLPLDEELPALLLQPLVENAVVHGIARLSRGGTLTIRGERPRRKRLRFVIENPVPSKGSSPAPGNRTALENIRQRLELAYEEGAHLRTRQDGDTFRVELVLPLG